MSTALVSSRTQWLQAVQHYAPKSLWTNVSFLWTNFITSHTSWGCLYFRRFRICRREGLPSTPCGIGGKSGYKTWVVAVQSELLRRLMTRQRRVCHGNNRVTTHVFRFRIKTPVMNQLQSNNIKAHLHAIAFVDIMRSTVRVSKSPLSHRHGLSAFGLIVKKCARKHWKRWTDGRRVVRGRKPIDWYQSRAARGEAGQRGGGLIMTYYTT